MARFDPNVPVVQSDPRVQVEIDPRKPLPVGRNRFSLVVVDDSGNESAPAVIEIIIRDDTRPTAVLDITDARGGRLDPIVGAGSSFFLSGARSSDLPPGKISEFRFTLLAP
jgi:hypothetical protein